MRQLRHLLMFPGIFFFCFTFLLPVLAQEKLPVIVKKIKPSTVVILTYDNEGKPIGQGSGFFISKNGDIITNEHVLADATRAEIKTAGGKVYQITLIVAEDNEADIVRASVNIPAESVYPLLVSDSVPEEGEQVVVVGNPLGLEQTISEDIVSAVREITAFGNIYQITTPISPGSSGSPVVNMNGEVIGIATFQSVEGQNLNFAIPGEKIIKLKAGKGRTLNEWSTAKAEEGPDSAEELYSAGLAFLLFWGDVVSLNKALSCFEKAIKENPRYAEAYFQVGCCYGKLHRYPESIDAYKQAIRIKPDWAEAHNSLGDSYFWLGRYQEAIDAHKQAIRLNPDYVDAHRSLGNAYGILGRYQEKVDAYKQAIRLQEATNAFKQAIRLIPNDDISSDSLSNERLRASITLSITATDYWALGVGYWGLGHYQEAVGRLSDYRREMLMRINI